tara:strand:- start:7067 stop:8719 length:1653 start_codon:yes stop_codon:yes gene_type:complete
MASPSNTILQVVGKLLQHKSLETENAKNRAFALQQLDAKNRQALSLVGAQEASAIAINKAKLKATQDASLALLKDQTYKDDLKYKSDLIANRAFETNLMSLFGTIEVGVKDEDGNYTGIHDPGVPRSSIHKGKITRAITTTHEEKIPGSDERRVSPAYESDIAKRNPYYVDPNVEFSDADQVYSNLIQRMEKGAFKDGGTNPQDHKLIPKGVRSRYIDKGFKAWANKGNRQLLRENIEDAIKYGDINTGYDEKYAKASEYITTEPQYRKVRKEISPETFFSNNNNKGVYLTGTGNLWINGEFQGTGAKMTDLVRNPVIGNKVKINISPDKKSASYVYLQESIARAQAGLSGSAAAFKQMNELDVLTQDSAEKLKHRWFKPDVFQLNETDFMGLDENELLAEVAERVDGIDEGGVAKWKGVSVQDQFDQAKKLWNNPEAGDMHEYRQKVVEQLGYLIRQINNDVDKTNKYDFYNKDNWKAYSESDPNKEYQGGLEATPNAWSKFWQTQNKEGISTYDEYLDLMKRLVSMREQLMMEKKENYNLSSLRLGTY